MSFLLKHYRPDALAPGALVPNSLAIENGLVTAFKALQFPIYTTVPNTDQRALTGTFESPHVLVWQERERFENTRNCTVLGKLRSEWIFGARLKFNNRVLGDQIFLELAAEPITVVGPDDANSRMDRECKVYLTSVDHSWRPSQDAGPGSGFDLRLEVR